jgi:hypothetical protein
MYFIIILGIQILGGPTSTHASTRPEKRCAPPTAREEYPHALTSEQGLTLVHFSAQPEPFLTPNYTLNPPKYPLPPAKHPLNNS